MLSAKKVFMGEQLARAVGLRLLLYLSRRYGRHSITHAGALGSRKSIGVLSPVSAKAGRAEALSP